MKMRRYLWPFLALTTLVTAACTLTQEPPKSSWTVLTQAKQVKCHIWPKLDKDLDTSGVFYFEAGGKGYFVSEGRARNLKKVQYLVPFAGDFALDKDQMVELGWGNAAFVGTTLQSGQPHVLLQATSDKDETRLELRTVPGNIRRFRSAPLAAELQRPHVIPGKGERFWILYKEGSSITSLEDEPGHLMQAEPTTNGLLKIWPAVTKTFDGAPQALPQADGGITIIWLDQRAPNSTKQPRFKVTTITPDNTVGDEFSIGLPPLKKVEAWAAISEGPQIFLAFVEGDSLLGAAKLRVAHIHYGGVAPSLGWVKDIELGNEHVADPAWVKQGNGSFLLLPKWLDQESTLGVYRVGLEELAGLGAWGIFREASTFHTFFHATAAKVAGTVVSQKSNFGIQFQLCKIGAF